MALIDIVCFLVLAVFFGVFIFYIIRKGGLDAALFKSRILNTVGESSHSSQGMKSSVAVHVLENAEHPIGLMCSQSSIMGSDKTPIVLSAQAATELAENIREAVGEHNKSVNRTSGNLGVLPSQSKEEDNQKIISR